MKSFLFILFIICGLSLASVKNNAKSNPKSQLTPAQLQKIKAPKAHAPTAPSQYGKIEPIQIVRNEYIMLRKLPHNEKALIKNFGERPQRQVRTIQNHHSQDTDQVVKISFTGASVDFYPNSENPNAMTILGMTLSEKKPRLKQLPIQVENTREDIEKYFEIDTKNQAHFEMCELQEITEGGPIYSSACVVFSFKDNLISQIDWVLPLD